MLRAWKQVELTPYSQAPKHCAGTASQKAFLIGTRRQVWGAQEGGVTPDFTSRLLGQGGFGVGTLGKLQDEWAGGPFGRRQRPCVVCSLPPTSKDSFPTQRRLYEAGPTAGGGGAGGRATGSRAAVGGSRSARQGPREHPGPSTSLASLPCLSSRGVEGLGAVWVLHPSSAGPRCQVRASSAPGLFRAVSGRRLGGVLSPRSAAHTLTSSSSSASANSKVLACTVLGTGARLPAWGAPHSSSRLSQEARPWGSTFTSSWRASISV